MYIILYIIYNIYNTLIFLSLRRGGTLRHGYKSVVLGMTKWLRFNAKGMRWVRREEELVCKVREVTCGFLNFILKMRNEDITICCWLISWGNIRFRYSISSTQPKPWCMRSRTMCCGGPPALSLSGRGRGPKRWRGKETSLSSASQANPLPTYLNSSQSVCSPEPCEGHAFHLASFVRFMLRD